MANGRPLRREALNKKEAKDDNHRPLCRVDRSHWSRAHRTSRLPQAAFDPLIIKKTTPARRGRPSGRYFSFVNLQVYRFLAEERGQLVSRKSEHTPRWQRRALFRRLFFQPLNVSHELRFTR